MEEEAAAAAAVATSLQQARAKNSIFHEWPPPRIGRVIDAYVWSTECVVQMYVRFLRWSQTLPIGERIGIFRWQVVYFIYSMAQFDSKINFQCTPI